MHCLSSRQSVHSDIGACGRSSSFPVVRVLDGVALRLSAAERRSVRAALDGSESAAASGVAVFSGEWTSGPPNDVMATIEWNDSQQHDTQRSAGQLSGSSSMTMSGTCISHGLLSSAVHCVDGCSLHCWRCSLCVSVLRDCALLRACGVSAIVCVGSVDAVVSSACWSFRLAVLSCVSERSVAQLSSLTGATLLPHPSYITKKHVGRAVLSVVESGWMDDASDRLLLSPPRPRRTAAATESTSSPAAVSRPPMLCVLSRHSNAASSAQFVSRVWSCLARLRNASRDGWRAWRGAGETEVACIRQLVSDRQQALAALAQQQQPTMAALCRPLVLEAWIDSLRQLLRLATLNTGCTQTQTDAILQSSAQHSTALSRAPTH